MNACFQALSMLFQYVISNTCIFYFRKYFSIQSVLPLWVSSGISIIYMLDFVFLSPIFVILS